MNCQAFRKAWLDDTDSDIFSHIETCEECIAWIETQMTTEEEVQFLKEVPLPQANLEERIMQAIYQNAGQGVPPHAATATVAVLPQQAAAPATSKRRPKGFPSFAWVSAAAVLLAVGFLSYQQLQGDQMMQTAAQPEANQANASNQIVAYSDNATQTQETAPAAPPAPAQATTGAAGGSQPMAKQNEAATPSTGAAAAVNPNGDAAPAAANALVALDDTQQSKAAPPQARTAQPENQGAAQSQPTAKVPAVNAKEHAASEEKVAENALMAAKKGGVPAITADQPMGMTAVPEQENSENGLVGPSLAMAAKQPITLSTFTDTDTAVQASDMPVPVLAQNPNSFSLSSISVQYESETSQKVTHLAADYKRNNDWIRIDVVRNTQGKRSLSIPGTFSATQLFAVNGEQAIAVSFDNKDAKNAVAEHAVHFNAQSNNQSLYVVITAHGVSLDELIEASKQLTWKP
ncbi:anti-sigma factor [Brevibacillus parabrevis]|nr:anti-sigma factor [Brevibacillus parabrevis]